MNSCGEIPLRAHYRWGKPCPSSRLPSTKRPRVPKQPPFARKTTIYGGALFKEPKSNSQGPVASFDRHYPTECPTVRALASVCSSEGHVSRFHVRDGDENDLQQTAETIQEAFKAFNESIGKEFDDGIEDILQFVRELHAHAQKTLVVAVSLDGNAKEEGVIGMMGVGMQDSMSVIQIVAVSTSRSRAGVGRALMNYTLDVCEQRRGNSLVCLAQDTTNSASFALYATLGFTVVEVYTWFEGLVADARADEAIDAVEKTGTYFRRMEQRDVAVCNEMFVNLTGESRLSDIETLQGKTELQPSIVGVRSKDSGEEEMVAYSTSFSWLGHSVAIDEQHLKALVSYGSKLAKSEGRGKLVFLCMTRVNPNIIRWALEAGFRVKTHLAWMVKGGTVSFNQGLVYGPGLDY